MEGRQTEATALTLRQLQRRFGALSSDQRARIQSLTLSQREALAEALLDFQTPDNLTAWLERDES